MKGPYWPPPAPLSRRRRRCALLLPLLVGAGFLGEIAFLGHLEMAKNAAAVESWITSFYRRFSPGAAGASSGGGDDEIQRCQEWLEKEDAVPYDRDFDMDPVRVFGAMQDWNKCSVGFEFGFTSYLMQLLHSMKTINRKYP